MGFEPMSAAYQAAILTGLNYQGSGAKGRNRTCVTRLRGEHSSTELPRLMERNAGVEPASLVWKTRAPAAIPIPPIKHLRLPLGEPRRNNKPLPYTLPPVAGVVGVAVKNFMIAFGCGDEICTRV